MIYDSKVKTYVHHLIYLKQWRVPTSWVTCTCCLATFFLYGNPVDHNFCASTISKRLQRQPEHMNSKQSGVAVSDLSGCISQQEQNDILVSRLFIKQSIFLFIFAIQTHRVFQGLPTDTLTGSKVEAARDKIQQINNPFCDPKEQFSSRRVDF